MFFAQVESPQYLTPKELDQYLGKGWFRMGQTIFTTNFLSFGGQSYSAVWLRITLAQFTGDKTYSRLRRLNARFRSVVGKANLTDEKEQLFSFYREHVPFQASMSIQHLLYGKASENIFDTQEISLYDDGRLIAVGFFDIGDSAAAGISSFYHPDYRKYSLGKYLIYYKIAYCRELGLQHFYPGYFVPGYSYFDYKLLIGREALHYLALESGKWLCIGEFREERSPFRVMKERLISLQTILSSLRIITTIMKYEFFDANLMPELRGAALFDYPLFLTFEAARADDFMQVIVYNVIDGCYDLVLCRSVWQVKSDSNREGLYSTNLLKAIEQRTIALKPEDVARWIKISKG
jgi:arginine-tRNA-protein transferase